MQAVYMGGSGLTWRELYPDPAAMLPLPASAGETGAGGAGCKCGGTCGGACGGSCGGSCSGCAGKRGRKSDAAAVLAVLRSAESGASDDAGITSRTVQHRTLSALAVQTAAQAVLQHLTQLAPTAGRPPVVNLHVIQETASAEFRPAGRVYAFKIVTGVRDDLVVIHAPKAISIAGKNPFAKDCAPECPPWNCMPNGACASMPCGAQGACPGGGQCCNGWCSDPNQVCCPPGHAACDNQKCTNLNSDSQNCGQCGHACPPGHFCTGGMCCPNGWMKCGNRCADIQNESVNCGDCNIVCKGSGCANGQCGACGGGFTNCGGICRDLSRDSLNCGKCGNICKDGACTNGTCPACKPQCVGKKCGPDGCGGTCAPGCAQGEACQNGQCQGGGGMMGGCNPACFMKEVCINGRCCIPDGQAGCVGNDTSKCCDSPSRCIGGFCRRCIPRDGRCDKSQLCCDPNDLCQLDVEKNAVICQLQ